MIIQFTYPLHRPHTSGICQQGIYADLSLDMEVKSPQSVHHVSVENGRSSKMKPSPCRFLQIWHLCSSIFDNKWVLEESSSKIRNPLNMEVSLRHPGHLSIFWIVLMESKNTPKIPTLNEWERVERWFKPSKKKCHWLVSLTNSKALILGGCYYFFQGRTVRTFSQQSRKKQKKQGGPWNPTKKPSPGVRSSTRRRGQGKYQKHHLQNHVQRISYGQIFFKVVFCTWNSDTFLHNWTVM